ncbi:MAG: hypothetical protein JEZ06_11375 [Anaerolineaceae bacterium]|nr:hypothetical protein [Anaerolineaceae bacterium]
MVIPDWIEFCVLIVAIFSLVAAVITNIYDRRTQRDIFRKEMEEIRNITAREVNSTTFTQVEEILINHPDLLKFEGITKKDFKILKEHGLSKRESAYMFIKFKVTARYFFLSDEDESPYSEKRYRYQTLLNKEVREAWKIMKKTISNHTFKTKMDNTIAIIEAELAKEVEQTTDG